MKPTIDSPEYESAVSVAKMRESDAYTIKHFVPSKELMFRAARGIFDAAKWNGKIGIVCGSGNNAGDGYALSVILKEHGIDSVLIRLYDRFSDDGKYYYDKAIEKGVTDSVFAEGDDLFGYDILVDCILGTGFCGEPRGIAKAAINAINNSSAFVISADINSGVNGDTGEAVTAVRSNLTVSIGYYKKGMFLNDAPPLIGDMVNVDIGIKLI